MLFSDLFFFSVFLLFLCEIIAVGVSVGDKDEAELLLLTAATAIANDTNNASAGVITGNSAAGGGGGAANMLSGGPADDAKVPSRVAVKKLSSQVRQSHICCKYSTSWKKEL